MSSLGWMFNPLKGTGKAELIPFLKNLTELFVIQEEDHTVHWPSAPQNDWQAAGDHGFTTDCYGAVTAVTNHCPLVALRTSVAKNRIHFESFPATWKFQVYSTVIRYLHRPWSGPLLKAATLFLERAQWLPVRGRGPGTTDWVFPSADWWDRVQLT